jgi:hypothetical protein
MFDARDKSPRGLDGKSRGQRGNETGIRNQMLTANFVEWNEMGICHAGNFTCI